MSLADTHGQDLEEHIVIDGRRDQGTIAFPPLLQVFLTTFQQQLKDEFFSDLEAGKSEKDDAKAKGDDGKEDGTTEGSIAKPKAKPKLQLKKKPDDDPFASDEEEEEEPKAKTSKFPSKGASKPPSKASGKPSSKVGGTAKKLSSKSSTTTKRIREESESDEERGNPKRREFSKSKE